MAYVLSKGAQPLPHPAVVSDLILHVSEEDQQKVVACYTLIHNAEQQSLQQNQQPGANTIPIRVIGYMLLHNTGKQMVLELLEAVQACNGAYAELGQFFVDYWIRPFRIKGRVPCCTRGSRPALEILARALSAKAETPRAGHTGAKIKALERDGQRCLVTGSWDWSWVDGLDEHEAPEGSRVFTQCAHIFSQSTNFNLDDEKKRMYSGMAWAVLSCFGYPEIFDELNGDGIHRLENLLTLQADCHTAFDQLKLWFDPIDEPEFGAASYRVGTTSVGAIMTSLPATVTFVDHTPPGLPRKPLPSRLYLKLHAACCKVARMSGAAEYLDRVIRDEEEIAVLASDGSSVDLVMHAMHKASLSQLQSTVIAVS